MRASRRELIATKRAGGRRLVGYCPTRIDSNPPTRYPHIQTLKNHDKCLGNQQRTRKCVVGSIKSGIKRLRTHSSSLINSSPPCYPCFGAAAQFFGRLVMGACRRSGVLSSLM